MFAPGQYVGTQSLIAATTTAAAVTVHGGGAELVPRPGEDGYLLNANVTGSYRDLVLRGSGNVRSAQWAGSSLVLERIKVYGASLETSGTVTARDLRVEETDVLLDWSLYFSGSLSLDRAVLLGNRKGLLNDVGNFSSVSATNLLVSKTRDLAMQLDRASGTVSHATVAYTGSDAGTGPRAVSCSSNITLRASIVWAPGSVQRSPLAGGCALVDVIAGPVSVAGAANADPLFVNAAASDFHLSAGSSAKDAVNDGPMSDFEGDTRPQGVRYDIGADESP